MRAELGLANLHAHHARVEALAVPADLPPAVVLAPPPLTEPQEHARATAFAALPFLRGLQPPATGPPALA